MAGKTVKIEGSIKNPMKPFHTTVKKGTKKKSTGKRGK